MNYGVCVGLGVYWFIFIRTGLDCLVWVKVWVWFMLGSLFKLGTLVQDGGVLVRVYQWTLYQLMMSDDRNL